MLRKITRMMACVVIALLFTAGPAFAASQYMPKVTKEMNRADYWIQKTGDPDGILAERSDVDAVNQVLVGRGGPSYDLANWSADSFNATKFSEDLVDSANEALAYYYSSGCHYDQQGHEYDSYEEWKTLYQSAVDNSVDPDVAAANPDQTLTKDYRYAVVTTRTTLQGVPSELHFLDDAKDPDFDYLYHTMLKVNEPLVVMTTSSDRKFYYVRSSAISGWVRADCIAICADKDEWWDAWRYPEEETLVVLDDKIYTEDSNYAPEVAGRKLPMGSCLHLAAEDEWKSKIIEEMNRSAHNNYVIWMPVRKDDGSYTKKLALVGENRKVSVGYPDLTISNILTVAMNQLGDAYGWGGMMGSEDCSGYIRDLYRCFGLDLARSTDRNKRWDNKEMIIKVYDLEGKTDAEKRDMIRKLPPGTVLTFDGHEMLYLGSEGADIYVISSISRCYLDGKLHRIRNCVINTLDDVTRTDGRTWLNHLNRAAVPYYLAGHADPQLSIVKAKVSGIAGRVYTGKARTQKPVVTVAGRTLISGEDYTVTYKNNTNAGTAGLTIKGTGFYRGSVGKTFKITKAANTLQAKGKTVNLKYSTLKKKNLTVKRLAAIQISKAKGKLTYKKLKGNKKITVAKSGTMTAKKDLKKNTYSVRVKVTAAGNSNYKSLSKTVTIKVKVR